MIAALETAPGCQVLLPWLNRLPGRAGGLPGSSKSLTSLAMALRTTSVWWVHDALDVEGSGSRPCAAMTRTVEDILLFANDSARDLQTGPRVAGQGGRRGQPGLRNGPSSEIIAGSPSIVCRGNLRALFDGSAIFPERVTISPARSLEMGTGSPFPDRANTEASYVHTQRRHSIMA